MIPPQIHHQFITKTTQKSPDSFATALKNASKNNETPALAGVRFFPQTNRR
jgi:hypothetical protein